MSQKTVTINGTIYDAHTGMPLEKLGAVTEAKSTSRHIPSEPRPSQSVHRLPEKSQTLNRHAVGKKTPVAAVTTPTTHVRRQVLKSSAITKFAPHPVAAKPRVRTMSDIGPVSHPMATKAKAQQQVQTANNATKLAPKPSQVIKQEAIAEALHNAPSHAAGNKQHKSTSKRSRFLSIASASLALLLLGGYFTYLNMPSLSVRVAAAQAGVNATYPEYRPDGYSLRGPVAYDEGQVSMKFAANAGPQNFSITQTKSSWDSSALEENYVNEASNGAYVPFVEHGLKIYVFDNNAAWVNGGVLYKITGDAPLSNDQIRRIATSM
ncbi:MAG: hypothetical protein JWP06_187 [Candidatus Saccharibacteria bacterium]|nr:hypothetical protein [Candidatus Saccharibacteria bacterium]